MVLTFALSLFSYHFVENPIRRNGWLVARTAGSLGFAALITTTGAAIAYASATLATRNLDADPRQRMIAESAERLSTARGTDPACVADFLTVEPKPCVFGAAASDRTVVLFGDLHADHWSTPLAEIASKDNFRLVTFMKSSCRATRITTRVASLKRVYTECDDWRELALRQIIAMKPDMVIISQFSIANRYLEVVDPSEDAAQRREWAAGLKSTLAGAERRRHPGRVHARRPVQQALSPTNAWRARSGRAGMPRSAIRRGPPPSATTIQGSSARSSRRSGTPGMST